MIKLKDLIDEGWGGMLQAQFYWLDKNGNAKKVSSHGSYANLLSKIDWDDDQSYQYMFDRGWARISIEDNYIFINTSLTNPVHVDLTKSQKEWLKTIRDEIYPAQHLQIVNIYRRPIEI
jgi:hypothetical protein